jgi:NIMA (never in mitosis gene a)-related kinase
MGQLSEKERDNAINEVRILASIQDKYVISYKEAFFEEQDQNLW